MVSGIGVLDRRCSSRIHLVVERSLAPEFPDRRATRRSRSKTRGILSITRFDFIVRWELRRSVRYGRALTISTVATTREQLGLAVDMRARNLPRLAEVIGPTIRDTDLLGELADGQLGLIFCEADYANASYAIERFTAALAEMRFPFATSFVIGAASCPADGVEFTDLVAHALSHPMKHVRGETS